MFYESKLNGLGGFFVTEVERAVTLIREFPDTGSLLGENLRQMMVRRFPYSIVYRNDDNRLLILAVFHQSRRPGYWRNRK